VPILLCRVDDRLIHGQVVIGWGRPLGLERIILVDDDVAANDWEQDLYRMALPDGIEVLFSDTADATTQLGSWQASLLRTAILTGRLETMARLHASAPGIVKRINLGGIHHQPGRTERLPYIYLNEAEVAELRALESAGAVVTAQDVPTAVPIPASAIK
jgi:PTS system mannose-specific IIB component/fructoselysine and glucoselysine-specific PTS system IIB component